MISVEEAKKLVLQDLPTLQKESISLENAAGRVLAEAIKSPIDHPLFDQTAVDGYAFAFDDLERFKTFSVVAEVKAGASGQFKLEAGEAARIFTGAPLPKGSDTSIMQEFCERAGDKVTFGDKGLKSGGNVRKKGEQIRAGEVALRAGTQLDAAAIGFLASLGISEVAVAAPLKVAILATGDEFAHSFEDLEEGKIFESNGVMLETALKKYGIEAHREICVDDPGLMEAAMARLTGQYDILLVTGGVSVGEYDFTKASLIQNGFAEVFHKVWQKPGKPLLFMRKGQQAAFGLPGNPRSGLVCFYEYVLPYLQACQGIPEPGLKCIQLPLADPFRKKAGRAEFLTGALIGREVSLKAIQGSHMLQSFAGADALVFFPPNPAEFPAGTEVEVHLLPR